MIDAASTDEYTVRRWRLPEELPRGVLAGLEGALGSWLVVVIPAIATYVATVSSPVLGEASWLDAARAGTAAWLLGLGQVLDLGATVSVVPLGVTALVVVLLAAAVRRARFASAAGPVAALVAALAVVAGAYVFASVTPDARGVVGALAVVGAGVAAGLARSGWPASLRLPVDVPGEIVAGLRLGARLTAVLLFAGAAVVAVAVLGAAGQVREVHDALAGDVVSSVVLVAAQLLAAPTAAVWALAWLAGPGFALGPTVQVAPDGVTAGPLPAVPALAALPDPGTAWADAGWVVVVPVLVAAVLAWRASRRAERTWRQEGTTAALAVVLVVTLAGLATWAASGVVGPLTSVGPSVGAVMVAIGLEAAAGIAVGVAAARLLPRSLTARLGGLLSRRRDPASR